MRSLHPRRLTSSQLLLLAKIGVLLCSILAVYWNDLAVVFNEGLNSDLSSYVLVLPFLILYLVYRKRASLRATLAFDLSNRRANLNIFEGTIIVVAAMLFYWTSSFSAYALTYHLITLPFLVSGALLILFGATTLRAALFPVGLSLFMTPLPAVISAYLGAVLSMYTSSASAWLLQLSGVESNTVVEYGNPVIQYASLAGGQVAFAVSVQCSGLYSLTGFSAFAAFASYIPRGKILAKVTLFGVGFGVVYGLNILRVTTILLIGRFFGAGAALEVFHEFAGSILIFIATLGILLLGEKVWRLRFHSPKSTTPLCDHDRVHLDLLDGFCSLCGGIVASPRRALRKLEVYGLSIMVALMIVMILSEAPLFVYARGPNPGTFSISPGNSAPTNLLPVVNAANKSWEPEFEYRDLNFETLLAQYIDAAWIFAYRSRSPLSNISYPLTVGVEVAPVLRYLDRPEVSLFLVDSPYHISNGYILVLRDSVVSGAPPLTGSLLVYHQAPNWDSYTIIYYWYERAIFAKGSSYVNDYMLITLHTTGDQLLSAGMISDPHNSTQIENALLPFAQSIFNYWEPIKSASLLAESLAATKNTWVPILYGLIVAGVTTSFYFELNQFRSSNELERVRGRIRDPEDQLLLKEIYEAEKGLTGKEALSGLSEAKSQPNIDWLMRKIKSAESATLVRRKMRLSDENSALVWSRPRVRFWNPQKQPIHPLHSDQSD